MTAIMLLVTLGPQILKMLGGGGEEPSPRDLRTQNQNPFRTEGERAAGIVRRTGQPESAGQNILAQMAMAGKPRTTTTETLETLPEEGLDIGSLLMMLLMMGGKKAGGGLGLTAPFTTEGARDISIPGIGDVPGVGGSEGPSYGGSPMAGGGAGIGLTKLGNLLSMMLG